MLGCRQRSARQPLIVADGQVPGVADGRGGFSKEASRQIDLTLRQTRLQRLRLHRRGAHALPIDGGEAANCVAKHQQSCGELRQPLVATALIGRELVRYRIAERRGVGDQLSLIHIFTIPRWRGETAVSPQQPENPTEPLALGVSFDESGSGSIGRIPGNLLGSLTGCANPLRLDPGMLSQSKGFGIENLGLQTTPSG